ncbi:MAG: hypothetical protein KAZ18_00450 [Acinetobacter sp.]|nr:hypothetical protein [Acinetobacter sp.]
MKRYTMGISLICALIGTNIHAVDVEDGVKNFTKSKDWVSFSIAEPTFGRIVATRAGTEDSRLNTTLTLTYPTNKKCVLAPTELIIKLENPIKAADSSEIFGTVQIDDNNPIGVEATLQNDEDAYFVFITMPIKDFDKKIQNSKSLIVNFKGFGVMNFSLSGANIAINNAASTCKNFSF